MEIQPFFSVIMPVYNVEQYLNEAVSSVLNQTFQDFEMILVEDKSTDKSGEMCDKIAIKSNKVRVIHQESNKGASEARNVGIENAVGKYIWFMDSDDCVEKTLLEKVYKSLMINTAQVVIFGLEEEYFDEENCKKQGKKISLDTRYLKSKEQIRELVIDLEESTLYGYIWNKVYDLEYLKKSNVKFEKLALLEDSMFNIGFFENVSTANILSDVLYYYKKRVGNSLTGKYVKEYFEIHYKKVRAIYDQEKRWGMDTIKVKKILGKIYCRYIFSAIQRNIDKRSGMNLKMRRKWLKDIFADSLYQSLIPCASSDNIQQKVMLFFLKNKMAWGCLVMGRVIDVVKTRMPILFAKVK